MRLPSRRTWFLAGGVAFAALALGRLRLERAVDARVEALHAAADARSPRQIRRNDLTDLPEPVRRYFEAVLADEQSLVRSVALEQRGHLRRGGRTGSWKPMTATQHFTVDPPGFVWDADVAVGPGVSARVVDAYENGEGSLRALVLSAIPVASAAPGPAMNEAELMRYLGEAVWFPTALLPAEGVEWAAVDDRSARATIEDGPTTASLVFHFDEDHLVERVTTEERYRQEDDGYAPWTGHFDDYRWHGGLRIPTVASVEWTLPEGDLPYWRGDLVAIDHRYS